MGVLPLHGRYRDLRAKQHQHPRWDQRDRSQPVPRHRRPARGERCAVPPTAVSAAASGYGLASAVALPPAPVYRRVVGAVDAEPVPRARLCGGYVLLFRGHGVRCVCDLGAFLKDAFVAAAAPDCEFRVLGTAALSSDSLPASSTSAV
ncbi:hypothetical protein V500_05056 [Pseudogymnoascus sp. VKM F-4518 (FW-2643)]|nr:hypothetical protein V500_05056 [Pseudogymnoascus sp. VKM F-4518 (FW-2643)]